ncbi:MAG: RluA family pseudouridine synthase [Planctomycetes bacterium]|nr:RluA family pseudouridine synthase [Planctomycetota bacterium]
MKRVHDDIRIVYRDDDIVVVDKPAGLTTVRHRHEAAEFGKRAQRFLPATLVDVLPALLKSKRAGKGAPQIRVRAVHRLDKETSGLLVLALTAAAESQLGRQFRGTAVERRYLALVRGKGKTERIASHLVEDRGDGRRGSSTSGGGKYAVTEVRLVEDLGDNSLVECRLETGRTHQVRIHLGETGTPLCGERIYDRPVHGKPLPDPSGFHRPALHASHLAISHPRTGKRLSWTMGLPDDMARLLKQFRAAE